MGSQININISDTGNCTNLPGEFKYNVQSTKISTSCAQFFDKPDCTENGLQLYPSSPYQGILSYWDIQRSTVSIGTCQNPCIPKIGESATQIISYGDNKTMDGIIPIRLYSWKGWRGKEYKVDIYGCTHVEETHIYLETFQSVNLPRGACFLGFFSDKYVPPGGGVGGSKDCIVDDEYNVLEFQDKLSGLLLLTFLPDFVPNPNSSWVPKKYLKALSPCQCTGQNLEPKYNLSTGDGYLELFSQRKFEGISVQIYLNFTDCLNLPNGEYSELDRRAYSLQVVNESCVEIYEELDCMGPVHLVITMPFADPYLSYSLAGKIRSLRVCTVNDDGTGAVETIFEILRGNSIYVALFYCSILFAFFGILTSTLFTIRLIRMKRPRMQEQLSGKEIDDFLNGHRVEQGFSILSNFPFQGEQKLTDNLCTEVISYNQPYNYQWEIPRHLIKYDTGGTLRSSDFGNVYKGTLIQQEGKCKAVAIKTSERKRGVQSLRILLQEIKLRLFVGQHRNIVTLIGCSTAKLRQGELWIVLEYCEGGTLHKYLNENRSNFVNVMHKHQQNVKQEILKTSLEENSKIFETYYVAMLPQLDSSIINQGQSSFPYNILQLIKWSLEIAEGMEFLAAKKIIHGQLFTKKILLDTNRNAKLCNFGLSQKINHSKHSGMDNKGFLAWRWFSLESLKCPEFSTESDIWSFGILLWEIFTLGEQPYPGVSSLTNEFIRNLEQGVRPTIPTFATPNIYNIMSSCWDENANLRPSFTHLKSVLQQVYLVSQQ